MDHLQWIGSAVIGLGGAITFLSLLLDAWLAATAPKLAIKCPGDGNMYEVIFDRDPAARHLEGVRRCQRFGSARPPCRSACAAMINESSNTSVSAAQVIQLPTHDRRDTVQSELQPYEVIPPAA